MSTDMIFGFIILLVMAFFMGAIWGMDLSRSLHRLGQNVKWDGNSPQSTRTSMDRKRLFEGSREWQKMMAMLKFSGVLRG